MPSAGRFLRMFECQISGLGMADQLVASSPILLQTRHRSEHIGMKTRREIRGKRIRGWSNGG